MLRSSSVPYPRWSAARARYEWLDPRDWNWSRRHARVVIETLLEPGGFEVIGLLDQRQEICESRLTGVPVLGGDDLPGQISEQE